MRTSPILRIIGAGGHATLIESKIWVLLGNIDVENANPFASIPAPTDQKRLLEGPTC